MTKKGSVSMKQFWLFQANPDGYMLSEELRPGRRDDWELKRYRDKVRKGDKVILWQSGKTAGVYGFGELAREPFKKKGEIRIDIRYDPPLKFPIPKQELSNHSALRNMDILKRWFERNPFKVSVNEWQALKSLVTKAKSSAELDQLNETREKMEKQWHLPKNKEDARRRQKSEIVIRQGQPQFRNQLLFAYQRRCAVTECDLVDALEAAHIFPYRGPKTNHVTNGLLLRADIHTLFDLRLMVINPKNGRLLISKTLSDSCYRTFLGKLIRRPQSETDHPSSAALKQSYEEFRREERKR